MNRRQFLISTSAAVVIALLPSRRSFAQENPFRAKYFPLPSDIGVHDVAPSATGSIWFTAQRNGALGRFEPEKGTFQMVDLGKDSAPHGVIIGPDGAPWVTDGGQNAIARVDPADHKVSLFRLPGNEAFANLNTAAFDRNGILWFTGQSGIYGRLDPKSGDLAVFKSPRGPGTYGITATPRGDIWYASLAGNHIAQIDITTGSARVVEPPTPHQGARRVWSDSMGRIWVSEWNSGHVSVHDPSDGSWKSWKLPGAHPSTYAVYVDNKNKVWLTDFSANAILRFDPQTETFSAFPSNKPDASVRQLAGRAGQVWGGESGTDRLVVIQAA
jgi:virginiamycin B lyase